MSPELLNQITTVVGVALTLFVFSYLLGDNFLYRIAIHVLIGAAAAFALITAVESVLVPWINQTLLVQPTQPSRLILGLIPFLIGVMLLFKSTSRLSSIGTFALACVIGVGAGAALWGAITGTLLPLVEGTIRVFTPANPIDGFIVLGGTISVMTYFTYLGRWRATGEARRWLPISVGGTVGQAFIALTLGAAYGLLILSSLTILTGVIAERLIR